MSRVTPANRVTLAKRVTLPSRVTPATHAARSARVALRMKRGLTVLAVCLVPALAACSGAAAQVHLPARAANAAAHRPAEVSKQQTVPPRQQVVGALTAYTGALSQADKSGSAAEARQLLRPYLAADRVNGLVKAVDAIWTSGERFYGQDVLHVLSVRITGRHAFVHDCDNTSGMGLLNANTGQTVPGSTGVAHANIVTSLDLVKGHWQVQFQLPEDVPCVP